MIGSQLDRYTIDEELGHGGMSTVYRGLDTSLERIVAVKVLHDHLAKSSENRQRFHREAKAIAKLRHNNILEIYDFSSVDAAKSYIVMEYVKGRNLREWVADYGSMPPEYVAAMALEICEALSHAHEHGVIHRDLKPENVMVSGDGKVKLMDFGIAHVMGQETMTQTGSLLGSPAHMAPELIEGERADVRSDIFSLGTVLYWLCAGRLPFDGNNAPQVFKRVLAMEVVDLEVVDSKIGTTFADLIRRCMRRQPDDRFQTVDQLRKALEVFLAQTEIVNEDDLLNYFLDPGTESERFSEQIVPALVVEARKAYEAKNIPHAVALFNRVLAFDPENEDVKQMMAALGRRRFAQASAVAGIAAAVVVAGVIAFLNRPADPVEATEEPIDTEAAVAVVVESTETATHALRTTETATVVGNYVVARSREFTPPDVVIVDRNNVNNVVAKPTTNNSTNNAVANVTNNDTVVPAFTYRFSVIPGAATFLVDGRPVDVLVARNGVELTKGVHRITATSPGAKPFSRDVRVDGDQGEILPVVLEWEDGKVKIVANTKAVVWMGKEKMRPIGAQGRNATFTIPFGRADITPSKKQVTLRIASAQDMGHPKTHEITVTPGQLTTLNVSLPTNE